jgi:hypothetical protein
MVDIFFRHNHFDPDFVDAASYLLSASHQFRNERHFDRNSRFPRLT